MLAVAYAFMLNDIEDAPDDVLDAARAPQNVIASGRLSARAAYYGCALAAVGALACYAVGGGRVLLAGAGTLALAHAYSWRPVRLKKWALVDVVFARADAERAALPDGLLALRARAGGGVPGCWRRRRCSPLMGSCITNCATRRRTAAPACANTTWLLGERGARLAMYATVALSAYCVIQAYRAGLFPAAAGWALLVTAPLAALWPRLRRRGPRLPRSLDMRGSAAADPSGALQTQALLLLNGLVAGWLIAALV